MISVSNLIVLVAAILAAVSAGSASLEWQREKFRVGNRSRLLNRINSGGPKRLNCHRLGFIRTERLHSRRNRREMEDSFEHDLPELLDVVALGMQAGMSFDSAFELYAKRFSTPLAQVCRESLDIWKSGLLSREEGLQRLSQRIATPSFSRFCSVTIRAARFGAPMTQTLFELADEARKEYRANQQEKVARAPVKMLIPTGTLILPAMLLLVMGPIVLDLMRRMV
ncbi:MAG: type II secretion system F family protein [Coriobacteriaceae bacterium]|nr:type II secretion system F family protein [Coriobacteriaceae bacterium]